MAIYSENSQISETWKNRKIQLIKPIYINP